MMKIFIVDDEAPARERLRTLLQDIAVQCPHELAGEAGDPQAALDGITAAAPDLVLVDVQMPGMSGLELAARIGRLTHPPSIVFITAHDQYALNAFDVDATDYLLKPVRAARLADALQRAERLRAARRATAVPPGKRQHFSVMERGRLLLVPVADVIYLKAEQKYLTLHTRTKDYLIEESLTSIEEALAEVFVRVHRNALVARTAIIGVERAAPTAEADGSDKAQDSWEILLKGSKERLPISRRQWPAIRALLR